MSFDDVHGNEMDGRPEFDDASADSLLSGAGADTDPRLAETIRDMRVAYTSTPPAVGTELAAFVRGTEPLAHPATRSVRRFERVRASALAKIAAAAAAVVAATGGLAVAGALPAPVQDALSHIGVGDGNGGHHARNSHADAAAKAAKKHATTTTAHPSSTTVPKSTTPTTAKAHPDNHGADVSGAAHDPDVTGCEHGRAVSAVASDGKAQDKPCPTTTTTVAGNDHSGNQNNGGGPKNTPPTSVGNHRGGGQGDGADDHVSSGGEHGRGIGGDHGGK